ncbi:MAG: ECF transporter S component, partial [Candidatus Paceibacterales bacterium]
IHLGDIAVFFTALTFGPWICMIAGGLGTGLADLLTGKYAFFAPLSVVVHGTQGFVTGWIYQKWSTKMGLFVSVFAGGLIVVFGYFAGKLILPIWGGFASAVSSLPFDTVQVLAGALGAVLHLAVVRAYPRLRPNDRYS